LLKSHAYDNNKDRLAKYFKAHKQVSGLVQTQVENIRLRALQAIIQRVEIVRN